MALAGGALAALVRDTRYKDYKLGGEGGWDYLTADSDARRVYISRGTHVDGH